jgi:starvation-inducible DNA-binding protein
LTSIKEEEKILLAKDMIVSLVKGHEIFIRQARKVAEIADKDGDFASVDMLGRRLGAHEKMAWFLRSHL